MVGEGVYIDWGIMYISAWCGRGFTLTEIYQHGGEVVYIDWGIMYIRVVGPGRGVTLTRA